MENISAYLKKAYNQSIQHSSASWRQQERTANDRWASVMLSTLITPDYLSMEEFLPAQALTSSFKAEIIKLELASNHGRTALYSALTCFGQMSLVVESFFPPCPQSAHIFLHHRNQLLATQRLLGPLIYEQQVVKIREDYVICLTLCEPVSLNVAEWAASPEAALEGLVDCAYRAAKAGLTYQLDCLLLHRLMRSTHNSALLMDFTAIQQPQEAETKENEAFLTFRNALSEAMLRMRGQRLQQVLFVCELPFVFDIERIGRCESWFDLAMIFNLLQQQKVTVLTESRTKQLPVSRLTGTVRLQQDGITYPPFLYKDGFRLDGLSGLTLEQLKGRFFEDGMVYYMTKGKYMCVRKEPSAHHHSRIEAQDLVYVRPEITKVEFINFLIGYLRFVEPLLHQLTFHPEENALELVFTNKMGRRRRVALKFHPRYVVKDEQLSMIMEKSRLESAVLVLPRMAFGDTFLIFLANCDKMASVTSLDISNCAKITEPALSLLLASPFSIHLTSLRLDGLPLPDLHQLNARGNLRELFLNSCVGQEEVEIAAGVQRLQAVGVGVQLRLPESVMHLALTQEVGLEQLRLLRHLPLVSLRIRLVEQRKTIGSFFNNLYSKDNPVRAFSGGNCRKTLKYLDVSHSTIKLKEIKLILALQSLQQLSCEGMERDRLGEVVLPHHIVSLSLKGSRVNAEMVQEMTHRINFFIRLCLLHTDVTDKTLEVAIAGKKYISVLEVGEQQLQVKFFQRNGCVEGIELHLHKLLRDHNEPILNTLLFRQLTVCKQLSLRCEHRLQPRLLRKLRRFLSLYEQHLPSSLTISLNSLSLSRLLPLPPEDTAGETITMLSSRAATHRTKLMARTLLAQEYSLPVLGEELGLQLLNVALHKAMQLHPQALLEVSIRNNRLLPASTVGLLRKYTGARLVALDFRNCLFSYYEVEEELFEFPHLESVNEGEYEIMVGEECQEKLQKVLKLFMRVSIHEKMKLRLSAKAVPDHELFFSILHEIISHHSPHIVALDIELQDMAPDQHSLPFWRKILQLEHLEALRLSYHNQLETSEEEETALAVEFEKLQGLNLFSLEIDTSIHLIIPSQLALRELRRLSINYSGMQIGEQVVGKLLKSTSTLTHLSLNLRDCSHISLVGRVSEALQRMHNLTHLTLILENTSAKEASVLELLENLHKNVLLERVELNANNCLLDVNELARVCEALVERVKFCHVLLYVLQQISVHRRARRPAFFRNQDDLLALGIELVFTA